MGVTCSVGALSSNNTANVTITASSSASNFPALEKNHPFKAEPALAWAAARLLLMVLIVLRRRESQSLLWRACALWSAAACCRTLKCFASHSQIALGAMLVGLLAAGFSCGGGSTAVPPTPSESGTVTGQGTAQTTSHSVPISVTVD